MGAKIDITLLDEDTIREAYSKALEPYKFRVWIACKTECDIYDEENPRVLEIFWDPVGAIDHAKNMRDERHETWIERLTLNIHESHEMSEQNVACLVCKERAEKLEEICKESDATTSGSERVPGGQEKKD